MTFPAALAKHHIDTAPAPDGCFVARFRYFESPAPPAIVQSMARAGYIVRSMQVDGQQTELCIKYQEAA
jgi:hypothetical protein